MLDFALNLASFLVHSNFPVILAYNITILILVKVFDIPSCTKNLDIKNQNS